MQRGEPGERGGRGRRGKRRQQGGGAAAIGARRAAADAILSGGRLTFPPSLPITARHDELLDVIRDHQVVIVAGETGSGKSTQLPKLCIEAGRGVEGMIGHTQPRRVAARAVAQRVADEVRSKLGTDIGFTVRFTDDVRESTLVKVMTDGILLAEIQRDRTLSRYDTLIIDEAHERSLNIDFVLGYLRRLLPERPDLKVIVTSATIDTERFARHFATVDADGHEVPAPVVEVTGRMYPVEVRYRPYGADNDEVEPGRRDERDQVQAVLDALAELGFTPESTRRSEGDVLVFLSGEREIHDAADAVRALRLPDTDVLPLYARLSSPEQQRIFAPHSGRRIVLATNVAETSLTVPGIRAVIDAGTARISRYSRRLKVQRLPIEPISQASANQRAGRCGRVAPGVCIRLYAEDDFLARPEFTEPEILRTNLASVILQMTAIGLGDVGAFPFVEPPDSASVRDGYLLLEELAAIEPVRKDGRARERRLTKLGRRLARLPVDPRLGRMVLEADRHGCVREVLVIAAALSIRDVRERPEEHIERANELHNRFRVDGSDLLSIMALWDHLRTKQRELSGNQFRRMCHAEFLNYLRVREWMDLYSQLRRVAGDLGVRPGTEQGHPDHVHRAVLAGHLSHIGVRDRAARDYIGARQARFVIARGSVLTKRPPEWVMAAELVETNRLYARRVAAIEPEWAEQLGAHLVKRSHDDVRWDARAGRAVATERVTLYGLPLVTDRIVGYDRVDPAAARAWFVTKALVERDWETREEAILRNDEFVADARRLADRFRRAEPIDDDRLYAFYDARLPDDVTSGRHFDRWWKDARRADPELLTLTEDVLGDGELRFRRDDFPDVWRQGDIELPLTYRFAPGEPLDGVTVHVPLSGLNQVADVGFDWQLPGHRAELVGELVRSLPKEVRRTLIPIADTTAAAIEQLGPPDGRLVDALARALGDVTGQRVRPADFDPASVPDHLRVHFVVSDDDGEVHDVGDDLTAIKGRLAATARASIAAAAPIEERRGITAWDVGTLPQVVESSDRALDVRGHPALLDVGDSVSLRVLSTPELQARAMRGGVRRLLLVTSGLTRRSLDRLLTDAGRLAIAAGDIPVNVLLDDCLAAAVDAAMRDQALPWDEEAFRALRAHVQEVAPGLARQALTAATGIVADAQRVGSTLARLRADALRPTVDDANAHLGRLVRPGFVLAAGVDGLADVQRYVRGVEYRLEHLAGGVERDQRRMAEVVPLETRYAALVARLQPVDVTPEIAELARTLEELRVATFAQPLGVRGNVSATRVDRALSAAGA